MMHVACVTHRLMMIHASLPGCVPYTEVEFYLSLLTTGKCCRTSDVLCFVAVIVQISKIRELLLVIVQISKY